MRAHPCIFQPGNFAGCGSEGVNVLSTAEPGQLRRIKIKMQMHISKPFSHRTLSKVIFKSKPYANVKRNILHKHETHFFFEELVIKCYPFVVRQAGIVDHSVRYIHNGIRKYGIICVIIIITTTTTTTILYCFNCCV